MKRLDATLRLFDGDITLTELVHMDLPSQRALIQSRIDNLKESQENFENGKLDSYSRRYASIMGGYLNVNPSSSSKREEGENKGVKNLRAPPQE
jgi:hypothetical protein